MSEGYISEGALLDDASIRENTVLMSVTMERPGMDSIRTVILIPKYLWEDAPAREQYVSTRVPVFINAAIRTARDEEEEGFLPAAEAGKMTRDELRVWQEEHPVAEYDPVRDGFAYPLPDGESE